MMHKIHPKSKVPGPFGAERLRNEDDEEEEAESASPVSGGAMHPDSRDSWPAGQRHH